jgi:CubicO group peptidase (beta-lactamase class C family)
MYKHILFFGLIIAGCSTPFKQTPQKFNFNEKITPGYAIRKIKSNQIIFNVASGRRASQFPDKITLQDKWHIGSCTKSMTSYLIAILVDEKKLKLETQIGEILKSPMNQNVKKLTVLDLLTHRSGLKEVNEVKKISAWTQAFTSDSTKTARDNLVNAILNEKPKFPKDQKFEYSNSNYLALGALIEKIENKSWEHNLKERVFDKLGMTECGFGPSATRDVSPPDQPWGHRYENEKLIAVQPSKNEKEPGYSDNPSALGPAGTVHCSFDSWSLFLKEMLAASKGQSKILTSETAKLFFTPYKDHVAYGGWGAIEKPWAEGIAFTMIGSNTLNYAIFIIAPKKDMILMGATNSGADDSLKELSEQMKKLAHE